MPWVSFIDINPWWVVCQTKTKTTPYVSPGNLIIQQFTDALPDFKTIWRPKYVTLQFSKDYRELLAFTLSKNISTIKS